MLEKKVDFSVVSYILGIASIIMAFFTPLAGLVFGLVGLIQNKKQKTELSKKAKKLNLIGIILSAIFFIASIIATFYLTKLNLPFPLA